MPYQKEDTEQESSPEELEDGDDYDQTIMEAMYSAAEESAQLNEPEQVSDATIIMPDIRETEEPIPEEEEDMTAEDSEDSYGPETEILMPETETGEEDESGSDEKEEAEVAEEPTGNTEEIPETGEITETSGDEGAPTEEVTENPEPEAEKEILEPAEEEETVNPEAVLGSPTVAELLEKAREAGDEPEIKEDKENQVTLLDYSKIL